VDLTKWIGSLDWIICGGESGPHARPCDLEWIGSIRDQCAAANVPCFIKQLGSNPHAIIECELSEVRDKKGGDISEWPAALRVRRFPIPVRPSKTEGFVK
jgi:protein gp37